VPTNSVVGKYVMALSSVSNPASSHDRAITTANEIEKSHESADTWRTTTGLSPRPYPVDRGLVAQRKPHSSDLSAKNVSTDGGITAE